MEKLELLLKFGEINENIKERLKLLLYRLHLGSPQESTDGIFSRKTF
jgi:hypothetical protein